MRRRRTKALVAGAIVCAGLGIIMLLWSGVGQRRSASACGSGTHG